MGITSAVASWLVPSLLAAAGTGVSAIQSNIQRRDTLASADEAKQTALKQAQANAEKAPELATEVGSKQAIKKRPEQFGLENSLIANANMQSANTIGQKETWG